MSKQFSSFQSAYRRRHSTETALLRVVNDLNSSMESGFKSILLSLDISAAFDTIDTDKLLQRLESDFGICGLASTWLRSYLTGRSCYVAMGDHRSDVWSCDSGVPQGSVLGPILFSAFVSPISRIMEAHGIKYHQYADDTQLYTEVRSLDSTQTEALSKCVSASDVLVSRQRATVEFQQNRGHDSRYKAGSIQAWPSFLLGHWRRRRGEGKHQNPWCSS